MLIYLLFRGSSCSKSIAKFYGISFNPVQKQLARLEEDGLVVSETVGKVRIYQLNPHYPFLKPLKTLLKSAANAYPQEFIDDLMVKRARSR